MHEHERERAVADSEARLRHMRCDPAGLAYGNLMRAKRSGVDPIAREAERVRTLMAVCSPVRGPADASDRDVRRAQLEGFRL